MPQQCKAKSKRSGERCRAMAMTGKEVCNMHGGLSPVGPASPHFKHGRYSQLVPTRLAANYEAARNDPDLLSLREEAALLRSRVGDLLARVDTGDSLKHWQDANRALADLERAQARKNAVAYADALHRLRTTIEGAERDWQTWNELTVTVENYRKLAESERKRMLDLHAMVSSDEAMAFASALVACVGEVVKDPRQLADIHQRMQRIFEDRHARRA